MPRLIQGRDFGVIRSEGHLDRAPLADAVAPALGLEGDGLALDGLYRFAHVLGLENYLAVFIGEFPDMTETVLIPELLDAFAEGHAGLDRQVAGIEPLEETEALFGLAVCGEGFRQGINHRAVVRTTQFIGFAHGLYGLFRVSVAG